MGSNVVINPADPFLVRGDALSELTDEQWTALAEIEKSGGGLARSVLSPEMLASLLRMEIVAPAGPTRVEITGIGIRLLARAGKRRQERS